MNSSNGLSAWPKDWPKFFNGCTDPCDMLVGPCGCGASHFKGEFELEQGRVMRKPLPSSDVVVTFPQSPCPICGNTGVEDTTTSSNKRLRTHRPCGRCEELRARDLRPVLAVSMGDEQTHKLAALATSIPRTAFKAADGRTFGVVHWHAKALLEQPIEIEAACHVSGKGNIDPLINEWTCAAHYLETDDGRFFDILEWRQIETKSRGWGESTVWFRARVLVPWPASYGRQEPLRDS